MTEQGILAIVQACADKDPNMSAAVPFDMVRRGLSLEQVAAELQGIEVTAEDSGPKIAVISQNGPSLVQRMLERVGVKALAESTGGER